MSKNIKKYFKDRNAKKGILLILTFMMLIATSLYTYKMAIIPANAEGKKILSFEKDNCQLELKQGEIVSQDFKVTEDDMSRIAIHFRKKGNEGNVMLSLSEKEERVIQKWELQVKQLPEDSITTLALDVPLKSKNKVYTLTVDVDDKASEKVSLVYSDENNMLKLKKGETEIKGVLNMYAFAQSKNIIKTFFFVIFLLMALVLFLGVLVIDKAKLENIYIILALGIGVIYILIFPTGTVPDGRTHFGTVYAQASKLLGVESVDEEGRTILYEKGYVLYTHPDKNSYIDIYENWKSDCEKTEESLQAASVIDNSMFYYFPQIIGVTFARLFSLNAFWVMCLGRIFSLFSYAILNWLAIKFMPFGKMIIFITSLLPMALELGTSYSYDSFLIALSYFSIAYNFYLIYDKEIVQIRDWIVLVVLSVLICNIKVVYIFIPMLCLLINKKKCVRKTIGCLAVGFGGALCVALTQLANILNMFGSGNSSTMISEEVVSYYTLGYVLTNPLKSLWILYGTIVEKLDFYFTSMLGTSLGWFEIQIPFVVGVAFFVLILLASVRHENEIVFVDLKQRSFYIAVCVMSFLAVELALMLSYTIWGAEVIEGVQGRYFLPFLPILVLGIMRNDTFILKKSINMYLIWGCMILQTYTVQNIIRRIVVK